MQTLPSSFATAPTRPAPGQPHAGLLPSARRLQGRRGARRAAATRADSQDGRPRGERPEARRAHAGPQRPRTPPPPPAGRLPEGRAAGKSRIPTRGRGLGGADNLRAPRALLQRRRRAAAPEPGTFPAWIPAKPTRSLAEGAEGQRSAGGKHERRAELSGGGPGCRARASREEDTTVGMSWGPAKEKASGNGESIGGGELERRGRKLSPGTQEDLQVPGTRASFGGSGRFGAPPRAPLPPTR